MPEDPTSWAENRRLIVSQLETMNDSLQKLADKIEQMNEKNRDRNSVFEAKISTDLTGINVRIAMLEVRAKIWGGAVGLVGGALASGVIEVLFGKALK